MEVKRMQTFYIRRSHPDYAIYEKMLHIANNIYNLANYHARQNVIHNRPWPSYSYLDNKFKLMYKNKENMLYRQCGTHFCQQILKVVTNNFVNWRKSVKAFEKDPKPYRYHRPRMPKKHTIGGMTRFILDNQILKLDAKTQTIQLKSKLKKKNTPWWRNTLTANLKLDHNIQLNQFQQLEVIPNKYYFKIVVVYNIDIPELKPDNQRYVTIDLGVNNLACVGSNVPEFTNYIINGRPVKSMNAYYNKHIAKTRSILEKVNKQQTSHHFDYLWNNRHLRLNHYLHEASKYIVDNALSHDISKIIIGNGCMTSKYKTNMSKKNNQNFVYIPFRQLFKMIEYKAANVGIEVIEADEQFTSQTSFLDHEMPIQSNGLQARLKKQKVGKVYYQHLNRREKRGLFISDNNKIINADLNGALQILKKVSESAFDNLNATEIMEIALTPVKINLAYC